MLMTALAALDPHKPMFQPPATQVRIKLIAYESRQYSITFAWMREQCVGVLLDNSIQQRFLGAMSGVFAFMAVTSNYHRVTLITTL